MKNKITVSAWRLKKEIAVLYYGFKDSRTSLLAKIPAFLSICYLLSPIDLIPDFIPFVGYLDDVVIVPLLLNLSVRLLPDIVRQESLVRAAKSNRKITLIFVVLVLVVIAVLTGIFILLRRALGSL